MENPIFLIQVLAISFTITFLILPKYIKRMTERGYVVRDYYKKVDAYVPNMGGLAVLMGTLGALILTQFYYKDTDKLLVLYFVSFTFGMFGFMDDLIDLRRTLKLLMPYFIALPIALLVDKSSIGLALARINTGAVLAYIIAPIYVMVVANLINMHSGFNGLSSGLSAIILVFVSLELYTKSGAESLYYVFPIFGAVLAFLYYNRYPARVFEGNGGSLMAGSAIGGVLVLFNMKFFGIILLFPHIVDFLMFAYIKFTGKDFVKYGKVREDGTIHAPNPLKMKFVLPYYFKLTEPQATFLMYCLTMFFGVIALIFA